MPPVPGHITARRPRVSRRRFLGTSTATAGGLLLPGGRWLEAAPIAVETDVASTDHFWYRLAPPGPYIDSQRGNKAFGFSDGAGFLS